MLPNYEEQARKLIEPFTNQRYEDDKNSGKRTWLYTIDLGKAIELLAPLLFANAKLIEENEQYSRAHDLMINGLHILEDERDKLQKQLGEVRDMVKHLCGDAEDIRQQRDAILSLFPPNDKEVT